MTTRRLALAGALALAVTAGIDRTSTAVAEPAPTAATGTAPAATGTAPDATGAAPDATGATAAVIAPRRLRLEIGCPAAIDRAPLIAALAIELSATPWIIGDTPAPEAPAPEAPADDATLAIDAQPCTPTAALELTLETGAVRTRLGAVVLPPATRVRALALLIAEAVADVPAPPARHRAAAATPSDLGDAVLARDLGPRSEAEPPRADELELSAIHRFYFVHPDKSATGLRITAAREIAFHRLRVGLDVGGDQMATPYGFDVFAVHLGGQLGIRHGLTPSVALEIGARGELTGGYARAAAGRDINKPWLIASGAGVVAAVAYDVSRSASLRLELELAGVVSADDLFIRWTLHDIMPPSSVEQVYTASLGLSLGIAVR